MSAATVEVGSPEWLAMITPSKVPVILGLSRYDTPFRLWHRMTGRVKPEPESDRFDLGHDMEHSMRAMFRRRYRDQWQISPGERQVRVPPERFGFPAIATPDGIARRGRAYCTVQFKTVRDMEEWGEWDTDQVPAYVAAQVYAEMAFTGHTKYPAIVVALGPFYESPRFYEVPFVPRIWSSILLRLQDWHVSMTLAEPPPLDDRVATYDCLRELHPDIDLDTAVDLDPAVAERARIAHANHEVAKSQLQADKNVLLDTMGRAQYAMVGDLVVARRQRGSGGAPSLVILKEPKPRPKVKTPKQIEMVS